MGKKTPSTSRKQLRSAAPYVAKAVDPPPAPLPTAAPLLEHPTGPMTTASGGVCRSVGRAEDGSPDLRPEESRSPGSLMATFDLRALSRTALGFAEAALTALPAPADILVGADPTVPGPPPGLVPPGDSRSMRQGEHFALVYRHGASVVSRRGLVGQRGVWRVVDYPGPAQASAAYAAECSKLRDQGFVDLS